MGCWRRRSHSATPRGPSRYEAGGQRIAVREGGDYGAVGKLFTFEGNGISETGWGRNGEIERVYVFEPGDDAITERSGGWYGDVDRTIVFEGIRASVFREPEAFLQFLVFTEWSESDREAAVNTEVAKIRSGGAGAPGRSRTRTPVTGRRPPAGQPGAVFHRRPGVPGAVPTNPVSISFRMPMAPRRRSRGGRGSQPGGMPAPPLTSAGRTATA